jgi:histidinol-phosphate aminotransferase
MVSPRPHGGPDHQGAAPHDFSTNANACGPCPGALGAVRGADPARYPDPGYARLREALAAFHGVAAGRIVPAASASEFIFRVTAWAHRQGARRVALPRHGYGDYAHAAQAWGLEPAPLESAQLVWACDPSSPAGVADESLPALPAHPGIVVLDRAYQPLRLSGALAMTASGLDRVWQLWSPNKALGLTGVRGAYAIAPLHSEADVVALEALAYSWVIGAHGVAMLHAWCEPAVQDWLAESLQTLRQWKQRQVALCEERGWTVWPSEANFFVARPGTTDMLRQRGIQLRDCTSFGLPGHVRLSVQPPASQDALREALK